jgi:hypothetical protein
MFGTILKGWNTAAAVQRMASYADAAQQVLLPVVPTESSPR